MRKQARRTIEFSGRTTTGDASGGYLFGETMIDGELKLVKVNIDEQPGLAQRYGVMSIPTIVLFKDGEPAAATLGAQPKSSIERALGLAAA